MNAQRGAVCFVLWLVLLATLLLAVPLHSLAAAPDEPVAGKEPSVWIGAPVQVTGGIYHTCALSADGSILCWGMNYYGQLGDGTGINRTVPVVTRYLSGFAIDVAAGSQHTCAVTMGGQVMCWGLNYWGQVGDGSQTDRFAPVGVAGLGIGYKQVTAGKYFSCALSTGGGVKCWGENDRYQLGDGTTIQRLTPVDVAGLGSGVTAIAAGDNHACALTAGGVVKCWGTITMTYKNHPDDPDSHTATWQSPTPATIGGLPSGIKAIAAGGDNACAITSTGGLKCWGDNYAGTLGIGTYFDVSTISPTDVIGLESETQAVAMEGYRVCAIAAGGAVRCWGGAAVGDGTTDPRYTPVEVSGLSSGVSAIGGGSGVACAVIAGGSLQCWGNGMTGSLGTGELGYAAVHLTPAYVLWPGRTYTFAISGRVLADGVPLAGATVTAGYNTTTTDSNGAYTLTTVSAGAYQVRIEKMRYSFEPAARTVTGPPSRSGIDFAAHSLIPPPPPQPAQPPLLVVHGIQTFAWPGKRCSEGVVHLRTALDHGAVYENITTLGEIPRWFLDGYDVWMAHLTSSAAGTPSIYTNADCLAQQVDQVYAQTGKKITIVAHSMGGVVTRACLARPECRNKVATVYTLGTPHAGLNWGFVAKALLGVVEGIARAHGIPAPVLAAVCTWQAGFCDLSSGSMNTFFNGNPANRNQPGIRYAFIGGDRTPGAGGKFLWLFDGPNDGGVGRFSAVGWAYPFRRPLPNNWMAPSPPIQYWTSEVHNGTFEADGYPYESLRHGRPSVGYQCIAYLEGRGGGERPVDCRPVASVAAAGDAGSLDEAILPAQTTPVLDGMVHAGETVTHALTVDTTGASQFLVAWDAGSLDIRLARPDGQEITPIFAEGDPETVAYVADLNSDGPYNLAGYVFTTTVPGVWGVSIRGIETAPGGAVYSVLAGMISERQLSIGVDKPVYMPGETMVITATLANGVNGIAGVAVTATLAPPSGIKTTLALNDLGGGHYQGSYVVPATGGQGLLTVAATGDDGGTSFMRQADSLFAVSSPTAVFGTSHSDHGIDSDGDGRFEALAVDVLLEVNQPGTFTVAAELSKGGVLLDTSAAMLSTTSPGTQAVRLMFDGSMISQACLAGPYAVTNAYLVDHAAGVVPSDVKAVLHRTAAYQCHQFAEHRLFLPSLMQ